MSHKSFLHTGIILAAVAFLLSFVGCGPTQPRAKTAADLAEFQAAQNKRISRRHADVASTKAKCTKELAAFDALATPAERFERMKGSEFAWIVFSNERARRIFQDRPGPFEADSAFLVQARCYAQMVIRLDKELPGAINKALSEQRFATAAALAAMQLGLSSRFDKRGRRLPLPGRRPPVSQPRRLALYALTNVALRMPRIRVTDHAGKLSLDALIVPRVVSGLDAKMTPMSAFVRAPLARPNHVAQVTISRPTLSVKRTYHHPKRRKNPAHARYATLVEKETAWLQREQSRLYDIEWKVIHKYRTCTGGSSGGVYHRPRTTTSTRTTRRQDTRFTPGLPSTRVLVTETKTTTTHYRGRYVPAGRETPIKCVYTNEKMAKKVMAPRLAMEKRIKRVKRRIVDKHFGGKIPTRTWQPKTVVKTITTGRYQVRVRFAGKTWSFAKTVDDRWTGKGRLAIVSAVRQALRHALFDHQPTLPWLAAVQSKVSGAALAAEKNWWRAQFYVRTNTPPGRWGTDLGRRDRIKVARALIKVRARTSKLRTGPAVWFCDQWHQADAKKVTCGKPEKSRDLTPLLKLTQLVNLQLGNTFAKDLSPLGKLTQLKTLRFINNSRGKDISFLSKLTKLERLVLRSVGLDVRHLQNLTQLESLDLSRTWIKDITPLLKLSKLKYLSIAWTNVTPWDFKKLTDALPGCRIRWYNPKWKQSKKYR